MDNPYIPVTVDGRRHDYVMCSAPDGVPQVSEKGIVQAGSRQREQIKRKPGLYGQPGFYHVDDNSDMLTFSTKEKGYNRLNVDFDALIQSHNRGKIMGISDNIEDYAFVTVLGFVSDMANSNGISLPYEQLIKPYNNNMKFIDTWRGAPVHVEHDNKDPTKAKGIIADVMLSKMGPGYDGYHRAMFLLGICGQKDPDFYNQIAVLEARNGYSIGATTPGYMCSRCGEFWAAGSITSNCEHMDSQKVNFYVYDGRLHYAEATRPRGFEISSVVDPAYPYAMSSMFIQRGANYRKPPTVDYSKMVIRH